MNFLLQKLRGSISDTREGQTKVKQKLYFKAQV